MNPISLGLDLLLALLLVATLIVGWRVNLRLKDFRRSQSEFTDAVAGLDRAAHAAEAGLAQLRAATDEALDLLSDRIQKARELAARLEKLGAESEARVMAAPAVAAPAAVSAETPAETALDRAWSRHPAPPSAANAIAAAEALVLRLSRDETLDAAPRPAEPAQPTRLRPWLDDDLFETPAPPQAANAARGRP